MERWLGRIEVSGAACTDTCSCLWSRLLFALWLAPAVLLTLENQEGPCGAGWCLLPPQLSLPTYPRQGPREPFPTLMSPGPWVRGQCLTHSKFSKNNIESINKDRCQERLASPFDRWVKGGSGPPGNLPVAAHQGFRGIQSRSDQPHSAWYQSHMVPPSCCGPLLCPTSPGNPSPRLHMEDSEACRTSLGTDGGNWGCGRRGPFRGYHGARGLTAPLNWTSCQERAGLEGPGCLEECASHEDLQGSKSRAGGPTGGAHLFELKAHLFDHPAGVCVWGTHVGTQVYKASKDSSGEASGQGLPRGLRLVPEEEGTCAEGSLALAQARDRLTLTVMLCSSARGAPALEAPRCPWRRGLG